MQRLGCRKTKRLRRMIIEKEKGGFSAGGVHLCQNRKDMQGAARRGLFLG
jgi:hypothetical protein